jgi:hypothetical protein
MANALTAMFVVSGIATAGAILFFLMPRLGIRMLFGAEISDNVTVFLMRNWGLLVFLIGCLLVVAGYNPLIRVPIAVVAAAEKSVLVALLLAGAVKWTPFLKIVAAVDGLFALLYIAFLFGA